MFLFSGRVASFTVKINPFQEGIASFSTNKLGICFERILLSDEPMIVIGPRSALFAPLSNLGLIIIDEEHETTYFQENPPRYSAIRVASFMAKTAKCSLVLGSATPSVEDYYFASRQGAKVELLEKAKTTAIKPNIRIIDFKNRDEFSRNRYYSNTLLTAIKSNLSMGQQTLIFHNRRGSSPLTICESCGEEILCRVPKETYYAINEGDAGMLLHADGNFLDFGEGKECDTAM